MTGLYAGEEGEGGGLLHVVIIKLAFQFSNFNFSCNVKLLQIIITAQQLMVSPDQSKGQIRRIHIHIHIHLHLHPHPRPRT